MWCFAVLTDAEVKHQASKQQCHAMLVSPQEDIVTQARRYNTPTQPHHVDSEPILPACCSLSQFDDSRRLHTVVM